MRQLILIIALLFTVAPTFSATPAWAQDDIARASQLLASANEAYSAGKFRAALSDYQLSYSLTKDDRVLYRIGLCYENLSNYQRAREHLELYLLADPRSQYRDRIEAKLSTLRELEATMQAFLSVTTDPPGGRVWVNRKDGPPAGIAPARIPVGPGTHTVLVRLGEREIEDRVTVAERETVERTYRADGTIDASKQPTSVRPTSEQPTSEQPTSEQPASEQPPEQTQHQATEPPGELADDASPAFAGELTEVSLLPNPALNALGWGFAGTGALVGLAVVGMLAFDVEPGDGVYVAMLGTAGALSIAGVLMLWLPNDTKQLPPAPARVQHDVAPQRAIGVSVRF